MKKQIVRQIRILKLYSAVTTGALATLCFAALSSNPTKRAFTEIDVQRINVVDDHGQRQLVIASKSRFPEPAIAGEELKGARSIRPAGIVFYDGQQSETGGLVTSETSNGRISLVAFDYGTGEVLDLGIEGEHGGKSCTTALRMLDPPPAGTRIEEAPAKQQTRITVQNRDKDASITLADTRGKDRIKLSVAASGEPKIEMFDADGKLTFTAP